MRKGEESDLAVVAFIAVVVAFIAVVVAFVVTFIVPVVAFVAVCSRFFRRKDAHTCTHCVVGIVACLLLLFCLL